MIHSRFTCVCFSEAQVERLENEEVGEGEDDYNPEDLDADEDGDVFGL